jgi:hypothetical protein
MKGSSEAKPSWSSVLCEEAECLGARCGLKSTSPSRAGGCDVRPTRDAVTRGRAQTLDSIADMEERRKNSLSEVDKAFPLLL